MKLNNSNQLAQHLSNNLSPVYHFSGDETLLLSEACDLVRNKARASGFTERQVFHVESGFDWSEFLACADSMSLFTEQTIIELRLQKATVDDAGKNALMQYCAATPQDKVLIISSPKIEKRILSQKWFKTVDAAGCFMQLWPINSRDLPGWIRQRMQQRGMTADNDAIKLLGELVEGNLLACAQEIEQLKVFCGDNTITMEAVSHCVGDSARFNAFDLIDKALNAEAAAAIRTLDVIRAEGIEPILINSALAREIRRLGKIQAGMAQGMNKGQLFRENQIWKNREALTNKILSRLKVSHFETLLAWCEFIDECIKGLHPQADLWEEMQKLILALAGKHLGLKTAKSLS